MASKAQADVLALARSRFELAADAESEQRKREEDDLRFAAGEQWPDDVRAARGGQVVDGVPIPARPMLTVSKVDQPVQLVINQARNARLGIEIHPDSEDATDETAEVLQGLIRHIEVRSQADQARNWAFERSVKCGRGAYRVLKDYADDSGEDFDQELVIERILNQASVYLDPYAQKPDWSDGEWAFIGGFMPADRFKREFPDSLLAGQLNDTFAGVGDDAPRWMGEGPDGQPTVRVMEYWVVEREAAERVAYLDPRGALVSVWADEVPDDIPPEAIQQRREAERRTVKWFKLNGIEILDEQEWDGRYIPIIPVIGREQNIDGVRTFTGVIGPAKDAQRLLNYAISTAVETVALEPKAPFIGYEGQFEGHENAWAQANIRNFPYLEVKPTTLGGQPAPLPQRTQAGSQLGPSLALVQQASDYIQATTFVYDPSLGDSRGSRSGRAVMALQQQSDEGNSNYLDNLAQVSMMYEAKVLLDLIPRVYDRPGRVARILGRDDTPSRVILNAPFEMQGKTPVPAPPGGPPRPPMGGAPPGMGGPMRGPGPGARPPGPPPGPLGPPPGPLGPPGPVGPPPGGPPPPMGRPPGPPMGQPMGGPPGLGPMGPRRPRPKVRHYDLSVGRYTVTVSVGKAFQSRVSQAAEEMGQVLTTNPSLMPIIGDLYFKYRDFPGHEEIAERLKRLVPPQAIGPSPGEDGPDPEQLQQQLQQVQQQSGQMIEQLTEQLQTTQQQIQQDQVKVQGDIQLRQMTTQADMQEKQMELQARMQQAQMEIQSRQQIAQLQMESQLQIAQMRGAATSQDVGAKIAADDRDREDTQAHEMGIEGHKAVIADHAFEQGVREAERTESVARVADALLPTEGDTAVIVDIEEPR
jgi:hypothetical protein